MKNHFPENRNCIRLAAFLWLLVLVPSLALADLSAWFLDVGQGDCTVVLCGGEAMIMDGGPAGASQIVYSFLTDTLKVDRLKYLISSHPHEDHMSGLAAALQALPAEYVLTPVTAWESKRFETFMEYVDARESKVIVPAEGEQYLLGDAVITILHCWPEAPQWRENDVNDMSIVVRIDYGNTSLIITGDAEETSEYMMIDSSLPLKADVLRIAHHGSRFATTAEFLEAVSPEYANISCGQGNGYSHPHQAVLDRLKEKGIRLFRTDLQGTIHCVSDGRHLTFSIERESSEEDLFMAPAKTQDGQEMGPDEK